MLTLYHELEVLAKSVHFKNLSAAALHVGLSQPQLSRIISRLEDELKVVLLDRTTKRKSGWTPLASELAQIFEKSMHGLQKDILSLNQNQIQSSLRIGTLEGLSHLALDMAYHCFQNAGVKKIILDILDLNDLDAHFTSDGLDLIFTSKPPGKQKYKNFIELGSQNLELVRTSDKFGIYSSFEYFQLKKPQTEQFAHHLVTNSLAIKKDWLKQFGGTGWIPTKMKQTKAENAEPVLLIGSDILNPKLWSTIEKSIPKLF
ncbi:MAG: LysR family transcriptional regulator [Pseudobdellovibrionaceae bacterium]